MTHSNSVASPQVVRSLSVPRGEQSPHKCHDCGAFEGEFHEPGCDMEVCPFCGGQLLSCGCQYKHFYPTYVRDLQTTVPFNGLPEAVYNEGLPTKQAEEWEQVLRAKGLVPYVVYPNMCCRCGTLWPEMFRVPDDEWRHYVAPRQRREMLCRTCYDWIKATVDRAQKTSWVHRFCESPIEEKLVDGFLEIGFVETERTDSHADQFGFVAASLRLRIALTQQNEITVDGKTYRVDFAIRCVEDLEVPLVIVEADGHNYHERSKEDARRDRSRDRAFLSIGIPTVRFTGSEIHANPAKCAQEALDLAINSAPPAKQDLILLASQAFNKNKRLARKAG